MPLDEVSEYHQTSGTTGQPVYQPDTWQDWEWFSECWTYILYAQGYRAGDRVFLPFGYNVFIAFWGAHNLVSAPKRIRIAVTGLKGRCPRPLDDGGTLKV